MDAASAAAGADAINSLERRRVKLKLSRCGLCLVHPGTRTRLLTLGFAALAVWFAAIANCRAQSPFTVAPSLTTSNGTQLLHLRFGMPAGHHIYADKLSFRWNGEQPAEQVSLPEPEFVTDKFSGEQKRGYERSFEALICVETIGATNRTLVVGLQGCDESQCYFPEKRAFSLSSSGEIAELDPDNAPASATAVATTATAVSDWRSAVGGFKVAARGSGYMGSKEFISLLDSSSSAGAASDSRTSSFAGWGWLATLGLILLGGLGLNLTPCILPMIPINLAIIGAGAKNSNRRRGFALGSTYGFGMALSYGVLGLLVVLTGSKFGTLNSSPWFNLTIALIFAVLSLAMFDKVTIDFSRFQGRVGATKAPRGSFLVALTMGAVAAMLAGACVAPVVISVLLLATNLYNQGNWLGLLLPFCLGLGMALPWPVAGAGLSMLPKPGAWMTRVKYGFGVLIALMAIYYGHIAWTLMPGVQVLARQGTASSVDDQASLEAMIAGLDQARQDGRPVVIDFWASWCKNCSAMEHATFKDEAVRQRLQQFHTIKFQAERPNDPAVKAVLDHFGALGLPTYVVLLPAKSP